MTHPSDAPRLATTDAAVAAAFLEAARARLAAGLGRIEHALDQLPDDDLYWRPFGGHNSLCTIVLHLCGALRQWIVSGAGGTPDVRDRHAEFTTRERVPRAALLARLRETVAEADAVLAGLDPDTILDERRIQGSETTVLAAVLDTIAHFEGHAQETVYIVRMRIGDAYRFQWSPSTPEEGAPV